MSQQILTVDHSLYSEYLRNPEKCRLTYFYNGTGIVPKKPVEHLQRGSMVARAIDLGYQGYSNKEIRDIMIREYGKGIVVIPEDKETEDLKKKLPKTAAAKPSIITTKFQLKKKKASAKSLIPELERVMRMYEAFRMQRASAPYEKIGGECKFDFILPGSKEFFDPVTIRLVGRMDEQIRHEKRIAVSEIKHEKATSRTNHEYRWKWDSQPTFYALALHEGNIPKHDVRIFITVIKDTDPPQVMTFDAIRTVAQIEIFKDQLIRTIQHIINDIEFGIDTPWAHSIGSYPCSFDACEYASICNKTHIDQKLLNRDFQPRKEHLSHVKQNRINRPA